jgi:hypothetical protein
MSNPARRSRCLTAARSSPAPWHPVARNTGEESSTAPAGLLSAGAETIKPLVGSTGAISWRRSAWPCAALILGRLVLLGGGARVGLTGPKFFCAAKTKKSALSWGAFESGRPRGGRNRPVPELSDDSLGLSINLR